MTSTDSKLSKIYYDPEHPTSFSNVNKLWLATNRKISRKIITKWLINQHTYTRHKPRRTHFRRNRYILNNMDQLWEMDLIVLPPEYAEHNDGVKYILG